MTLRPLGRSGLLVGPLALGGNVFGWTADEATSHAILDDFARAGPGLVDTADIYSRWAPGHSGGESETVLGNWLARPGNRERVVVATKVGMDMGGGETGLSRAYIRQAVERSLNRLRVDTIDLYQSHADDPHTPLDETLGAFGELIAAGMVRAVGASNYSAARLTEALDVSRRLGLPRYECLQPEYNLHDRAGFETELGPLCAREGLGVIPYFSLAAGFLTGKYRTPADTAGKARGGKVSKYLTERGFRVLGALDAEAGRLGSTPARVALAWLLAKPTVTAPIASATSREQLADLLAAATLALDPDAVGRLDAASA